MSNYFYIFHAWKITAFGLFTIRQVSSVFFNFTKILPFFYFTYLSYRISNVLFIHNTIRCT